MGYRRKWAAALLAASLLVGGAAFPTLADELEDELADIQSQISSAREDAANAEEIIKAVSARLNVIQAELDAANAELERIWGLQAAKNEEIRQTEAELQRAIDDLHARQAVLARRVRAIYMHGQLNYLDVIVGANSFSDFANRLELLKRIVRADFNLILEIRDRQSAIEAKRAVLEEQKAELDALENDAKKQQEAIDAKRAEQQAALDEAREHKAAAEAWESELQAASADIEERIQARMRQSEGGYVQGTGQLSWPCNGPITSEQGWRTHPIFGTEIYHSGMDIGVPEGTPIHAADSGTVIDAEWISGYGNAVIIDHGNGMQTVYAHNSGFAVSVGEAVSKGQVIAYAGQTGYATGPHCHFEVRVNGVVDNPRNYL